MSPDIEIHERCLKSGIISYHFQYFAFLDKRIHSLLVLVMLSEHLIDLSLFYADCILHLWDQEPYLIYILLFSRHCLAFWSIVFWYLRYTEHLSRLLLLIFPTHTNIVLILNSKYKHFNDIDKYSTIMKELDGWTVGKILVKDVTLTFLTS